jgi:hypothetical protein
VNRKENGEGKNRMWKWMSYWLDLYHRIGGRERERALTKLKD